MFNNSVLRGITLALSGGLTLCLLLMPFIFGKSVGGEAHGLLMGMMVGISSGFFYGFGFQSTKLGGKIFLSPLLSWTLMIGSLLRLFTVL
jgi:predicted membrane protein